MLVYTRRSFLRRCTYKGEAHYFHGWFQEGGFNGGTWLGQPVQEGSMDIGAILEDEDGRISKVWDINEIKFDVEVGR